MVEKGEAELPILAEGTSVHVLAGGRWWKGLPPPQRCRSSTLEALDPLAIQ